MNKIVKISAVAALIAVSASASAWWNNGWGNNGIGDGYGDASGDFSFGMSGSARGNGYGRGYNRYDGYNGYGYAPYYGAPLTGMTEEQHKAAVEQQAKAFEAQRQVAEQFDAPMSREDMIKEMEAHRAEMDRHFAAATQAMPVAFEAPQHEGFKSRDEIIKEMESRRAERTKEIDARRAEIEKAHKNI